MKLSQTHTDTLIAGCDAGTVTQRCRCSVTNTEVELLSTTARQTRSLSVHSVHWLVITRDTRSPPSMRRSVCRPAVVFIASYLAVSQWWGAGIDICLGRGADLHMA